MIHFASVSRSAFSSDSIFGMHMTVYSLFWKLLIVFSFILNSILSINNALLVKSPSAFPMPKQFIEQLTNLEITVTLSLKL
jgi:hypothetical protein